jgi:hypothetical protein
MARSTSTDTDLLDAGVRLVDDHPHFPAGTVLMCFYRTVWCLRRTGCPPTMLAGEAERMSRDMLRLGAAPKRHRSALPLGGMPSPRAAAS